MSRNHSTPIIIQPGGGGGEKEDKIDNEKELVEIGRGLALLELTTTATTTTTTDKKMETDKLVEEICQVSGFF